MKPTLPGRLLDEQGASGAGHRLEDRCVVERGEGSRVEDGRLDPTLGKDLGGLHARGTP